MEKVKSEIKITDEEQVFTTADLTICHGKNGSDLVTAFRERYKFKNDGTPVRLPEGFDFLDKGFYYGKVDTMGRVIIPKKESLVRVNSKFTGGSDDEDVYLNKDLYALYLDFFESVKLDFAIGKYEIDAFLEVFNIQQGAAPHEELEENYKDIISSALNDIYLGEVFPNTTNIVDNAKDFPTYLDIILKLYELGKINKSTLYSEHILTGDNLITNSGLMFEILNEVPYDDDMAKFETYYSHTMYGRIVCFLYLHGIRYDANVPWRFVLDFNLEPTVKKLGGISKQQFFDRDFDIVEGTYKEMKIFFETIFLSYQLLLETFPVYFKSEQIFACNKNFEEFKKSKTQSFTRKLYSQKEFDAFFKKNFEKLLYQYASTLNSMFEKRTNIRQLLLDISNKFKKGLDKESLVRYTFNKIKYC